MPLNEMQLVQARERAVVNIAARLQLPVETVRVEQSQMVDAAVEAAAKEQLRLVIEESARDSVGTVIQKTPLDMKLKAQLDLGKSIVDLVAGNDEYRAILTKNAQMQKAKYDSYTAAGFSEEQAFRLLEAELLGKAGVRAGR